MALLRAVPADGDEVTQQLLTTGEPPRDTPGPRPLGQQPQASALLLGVELTQRDLHGLSVPISRAVVNIGHYTQ